MKDKASRINEPINDILHLTKQFESSLMDEIKGNKGWLLTKSKKKLIQKAKNGNLHLQP